MQLELTIMARLLKQAYSLLLSGYVAFIISLIVLIVHFPQCHLMDWIALIISSSLLVTHHYVAIRVQFDAELLECIYNLGKSDSYAFEQLTKQFDQSMINLNLLSTHKAGRTWQIRLHGCQKLFKLQCLLWLLQYIVLIFIIAMSFNVIL